MLQKSALLAVVAVALSATPGFAGNYEQETYTEFKGTTGQSATDLSTKNGASVIGFSDGNLLNDNDDSFTTAGDGMPTLISLKNDLNTLGQACFNQGDIDYEQYGGWCDWGGDGWWCSCTQAQYSDYLTLKNEMIPQMRNTINGLNNWSQKGISAAEQTTYANALAAAETTRQQNAANAQPAANNVYSPNTDPVVMAQFNLQQNANNGAGAYRNVYGLAAGDITQYNQAQKQLYQQILANFLK